MYLLIQKCGWRLLNRCKFRFLAHRTDSWDSRDQRPQYNILGNSFFYTVWEYVAHKNSIGRQGEDKLNPTLSFTLQSFNNCAVHSLLCPQKLSSCCSPSLCRVAKTSQVALFASIYPHIKLCIKFAPQSLPRLNFSIGTHSRDNIPRIVQL